MLKYLCIFVAFCLAADAETIDYQINTHRVYNLTKKEKCLCTKTFTITQTGSLTLKNTRNFVNPCLIIKASEKMVINGKIEAKGINLILISNEISLEQASVSANRIIVAPLSNIGISNISVKNSEICATSTIQIGEYFKKIVHRLHIDGTSNISCLYQKNKVYIAGRLTFVSGTITAPLGYVTVFGNSLNLSDSNISTKASVDGIDTFGDLAISSDHNMIFHNSLVDGTESAPKLCAEFDDGRRILVHSDILSFLQNNHVKVSSNAYLSVNCNLSLNPAVKTIFTLSSSKTTINGTISDGVLKLKGCKRARSFYCPVVINQSIPSALKPSTLILERVDLSGMRISLPQTTCLKTQHSKVSLYDLGSVKTIENEASLIRCKFLSILKEYEYILIGKPEFTRLDILVKYAKKITFNNYSMDLISSCTYLDLQNAVELYVYNSSIRAKITNSLAKGINKSSKIMVKVPTYFHVSNYKYIGNGGYESAFDDLIKYSKRLYIENINTTASTPQLINLAMASHLTVKNSLIKVCFVDSLIKVTNISSKIFGLGLCDPKDLLEYKICLADPAFDILLPVAKHVTMVNVNMQPSSASIKLLHTTSLIAKDSNIKLQDTGLLNFIKKDNSKIEIDSIASEFMLKKYHVLDKLSASDPLLSHCHTLYLEKVNTKSGDCLDLRATKILKLLDSYAIVKIYDCLSSVSRINSRLYVRNLTDDFSLDKYVVSRARDIFNDNLLLKAAEVNLDKVVSPSCEFLVLPKATRINISDSTISLHASTNRKIVHRVGDCARIRYGV